MFGRQGGSRRRERLKNRFIGFIVMFGFVAVAVLAPMESGGPAVSAPSPWNSLTGTARRQLESLDRAFLPLNQNPEMLRTRLKQEIAAADDQWRNLILEWIRRRAWSSSADLMIDAAECGGPLVRSKASTHLCTMRSPLVTSATVGDRIRALMQNETDPSASANWQDLASQLGI